MTLRMKFAAFAALALLAAAPAMAALPLGKEAPQIVTRGALAGKVAKLDLHQLLKKGPVVLYFYPKAFTSGCTVEAHAFSEATDDFAKVGATVVGMSADTVDVLKRFSTEACRDKFMVASAGPQVIAKYDVELLGADGQGTGLTDRVSYVIGTDGKVKFALSSRNPNEHVTRTLQVVQDIAGVE